MIIDCISDLHGSYPELEGGDLLIVAGDLTARATEREYRVFLEWVRLQSYDRKIFIGGNHDNWLYERCAPSPFPHGHPGLDVWAEYLCDSGTEIHLEEPVQNMFDHKEMTWGPKKTLKIWGSPWTKTFKGMNPHCKAFTCDTDEELFEKFKEIPHDVDILITHSPPYLIRDKTPRGEHVGSSFLRGALEYVFRPKLWVCGHIHNGYGQEEYKGTTIVNASHMNEAYEPVNKPIRIIL